MAAPVGKYSDLTDAEKAHWNEFTTLRLIEHWPGFDTAQRKRQAECHTWIEKQRKLIKDLANGDVAGTPGWEHAHRRSRYNFLGKCKSGAPKHRVNLPAPAVCTDAEKAYIEERECWMWVTSTTAEQKKRKQDCTNWLVNRRKQLYRLLSNNDPNNEKYGRRARWRALCVATRTGEAYKSWDKSHDKWGKAEKNTPADWRAKAVKQAASFIGVHESPRGSNRGSPQPSGWQKRVFGGDGVAWCACFAVCQAWDVGVKGSGTASVFLNMQLAIKGQGIYKAFTTDPSRVRPGDHAVISCSTCHFATVEKAPYDMIEGNTSSSNGSNFNGGEVARHNRRGQVVGWCLVRDPS